MTTKPTLVALDLGYGYTDGLTASHSTRFPSVTGHAEHIRYQNNVMDNRAVNGIALETDRGNFFVGDLALKQSSIYYATQDRNRVKTDESLLYALAAFSELTVSGPVHLVTGLPVEWYADKDIIKEQLTGEHTIKRAGRETVQIVVEDVIVGLQPFGALFAVIFNEQGKIQNPAVARGRNGVIDVGMHTTDWIIADQGQYIEPGSDSTTMAMGAIYHRLGEAIHQTYGRKLKLHQLDQVVRQGYVSIRNHRHPIGDMLDPILRAAANEILSEILVKWQREEDGLDNIFIAGGGSSLIGPYLTDRFPHLVILPQGERAIVTGYYRYGLFKWPALRPAAPAAQKIKKPARRSRTPQRNGVAK